MKTNKFIRQSSRPFRVSFIPPELPGWRFAFNQPHLTPRFARHFAYKENRTRF